MQLPRVADVRLIQGKHYTQDGVHRGAQHQRCETVVAMMIELCTGTVVALLLGMRCLDPGFDSWAQRPGHPTPS